MSDIHFAHPWFFVLLLIIPWLWVRYKNQSTRTARKLKVPAIGNYSKAPISGRVKHRNKPFYIRLIALSLLIIALARPQKPLGSTPLHVEGIDIMLSLDISGSMLAQDLQPDRLQATLKVAKDFIQNRPNDRIGLVIFAAESFTQSPLTIDHNSLVALLENIHIDMLEDGTAIGMGLATAVKRLKDSDAQTKVIILMTDGDNNTGYIDPHTAMNMVKTEGIRTYTVAVGRNGTAPFPVRDPFTGAIVYQEMIVQIDEELLQEIAQETGGRYYRAENNKELAEIYHEIDQLETSKIKVDAFTPKKELFSLFVGIALVLLFLEWMLNTVYLKQDL